ncbi:MAG: phospho-sugar mutase [Verrucomicrobiota bacterium]
MTDLSSSLKAAVESGQLLPSSRENILSLLEGSSNPIYSESIQELVQGGQWSELNDRFFRTLAFGTGGLRSRTIGKLVTQAERGTPQALARPEFPCTGTNAMNYFNVGRSTRGMITYLKKWLTEQGETHRKPALVIAHDTRHFSRDFAEFAARTAAENGCHAYLKDSCRSTPYLSFATRHLRADAGIMLTASHNPPHDNGFKAYFNDGAQIVEPHASGIIAEVNAIKSETYHPLPESEQGEVKAIGDEVDEAYLQSVEGLLLRPELLKTDHPPKVVFTNIHGTGGIHSPLLLRKLGFDCLTVPEQDVQDGRFPTVESPNPENAPALQMGIDLAEKEGADIVIGTDPDCDRMGVVVRDAHGKMVLLTGNQIGSLMAWYRTKTMFELGWLNEENKGQAVIIKTFVTTDLQKKIAQAYGVHWVDTLTGFKYIGDKLLKYEKAVPGNLGNAYRELSPEASRALRLEHSKFFIFGGEESYGYLGSDSVRDKDGNGAVVMFAELAAYAAHRGLTLPELLDEVFAQYGYFKETVESVYYEGASGAAQIQKLANSYSENPPSEMAGVAVTDVMDFAKKDYLDAEGDPIPKEKMIIMTFANGYRLAVRPSGTEPKIKYYLFGQCLPEEGAALTPEELAAAKEAVATQSALLFKAIEADAAQRVED